MRFPPPGSYQRGRSKSPTIDQRGTRCRRSARRQEAKADCKAQREAGKRARSKNPNALPLVAPARQNRALERTTTRTRQARSQSPALQPEDKAPGAALTLWDCAQFRGFAQIFAISVVTPRYAIAKQCARETPRRHLFASSAEVIWIGCHRLIEQLSRIRR